MNTPIILSLIGVITFALIHIAAAPMNRNAKVRPQWLSAASGMSVAYVFIHLLPELDEEQQQWLEALPNRPLYWFKSQVYLFAFVGVMLALILDRAAQRERGRFWMQTISAAIYNVLLGGFALRVDRVMVLILGVIAFGAHLMVADRALFLSYGTRYERVGRWVLVGALFAGWVFSTLRPPPVIAHGIVLGMISGSIIVNVIKQELPGRNEGPLAPWIAGALSYTGLLLAMTFTEFR